MPQTSVFRNYDILNISPEWSAVGFWFRNLLDTAESLGCQRDALLEEAGLDAAILSHLEKHYPIVGLFRLFDLISRRCQEPDIGILNVLNSHPCSMGILGMAVNSSATLIEAWETVFRFRHLVMNTGSSQMLTEGDTISIRWYPYSRSLVTQRYFVDAVVAGWVYNSQALSRREISPISAELSYNAVEKTPLFVQTYGDKVRFNRPYNSLTFRRSEMEAPVYYANPRLYRLLCAQADQDIAHLKEECPFAEKVEYQIRQQLGNGEVSVDTIAELLHVSARTLQRHLTREHASFHELLTNVRHELALFYLQDEELSILDVSLRLGYNQSSSFCTAFKSWTGKSPSDYRVKRI